MNLVIIESPYRGQVAKNTEYAKECLAHSLSLGEAPIASHLLYPQVLDDRVPKERQQGIDAGLAWSRVCSYHAFYIDLGWSEGMKAALAHCRETRKLRVLRSVNGNKLHYPEEVEPKRTPLEDLLDEAQQRYAQLTPEQKEEMWQAQRKSWVVGEHEFSNSQLTREEVLARYNKLIGGSP
jgi:hypothetical protein